MFKVSQYAAIFILALSIGYFLPKLMSSEEQVVSNQVQKFSAQKGSIAVVTLQDGSKIWLNSNSELSVLKKSPYKIVTELKGEAFFEIKHDENREFIVDLGKFKVKDLGTSFNIRAYPEKENIQTTLIEGRIKVLDPQDRHVTEMSPGESLTYDCGIKRFNIGQADTSIVTAWKNGKFAFINQNLSGICSELGNWYDVDIILKDKNIGKEKYTCMIKRSPSIKHVLEMLKQTSNINYQIIEKEKGKDQVIIK